MKWRNHPMQRGAYVSALEHQQSPPCNNWNMPVVSEIISKRMVGATIWERKGSAEA